MSVDWLRFQPDEDAKILHVEILVGKLLELQPSTTEATDEFCQELYPVLDQIQALCLQRGYKQVCSADLSGIKVRSIKPMTAMRMIWNVYEHTKNCILLQGCEVSGGGQFFNTLVGALRGLLPPFMRNMITLLPGTSVEDEDEDCYEDAIDFEE